MQPELVTIYAVKLFHRNNNYDHKRDHKESAYKWFIFVFFFGDSIIRILCYRWMKMKSMM